MPSDPGIVLTQRRKGAKRGLFPGRRLFLARQPRGAQQQQRACAGFGDRQERNVVHQMPAARRLGIADVADAELQGRDLARQGMDVRRVDVVPVDEFGRRFDEADAAQQVGKRHAVRIQVRRRDLDVRGRGRHVIRLPEGGTAVISRRQEAGVGAGQRQQIIAIGAHQTQPGRGNRQHVQQMDGVVLFPPGQQVGSGSGIRLEIQVREGALRSRAHEEKNRRQRPSHWFVHDFSPFP